MIFNLTWIILNYFFKISSPLGFLKKTIPIIVIAIFFLLQVFLLIFFH
jgi:hypothetical protein